MRTEILLDEINELRERLRQEKFASAELRRHLDEAKKVWKAVKRGEFDIALDLIKTYENTIGFG